LEAIGTEDLLQNFDCSGLGSGRFSFVVVSRGPADADVVETARGHLRRAEHVAAVKQQGSRDQLFQFLPIQPIESSHSVAIRIASAPRAAS